jgi:hypothetical protein
MAAKPKPQIFEHKPAKTIAGAVAAAKKHVAKVNEQAK